MAHIFEAMEQARKGRRTPYQVHRVTFQRDPLTRRLEDVYRRVAALLPVQQSRDVGRIVQFIRLREGAEGTSDISARFAAVASRQLRAPVLHVDLEPHGAVRVIDHAQEWPSVAAPLFPEEHAHDPAAFLQDARWTELLERFRNQFPMAVLEARPLDTAPDAVLAAEHADGVLLILESGRTRPRAAEAAVEQIRRYRGRLLGVILNDCRHSDEMLTHGLH